MRPIPCTWTSQHIFYVFYPSFPLFYRRRPGNTAQPSQTKIIGKWEERRRSRPDIFVLVRIGSWRGGKQDDCRRCLEKRYGKKGGGGDGRLGTNIGDEPCRRVENIYIARPIYHVLAVLFAFRHHVESKHYISGAKYSKTRYHVLATSLALLNITYTQSMMFRTDYHLPNPIFTSYKGGESTQVEPSPTRDKTINYDWSRDLNMAWWMGSLVK